MGIIRKAAILDKDDLLLLENHRFDKEYKLRCFLARKNVTRLMLLIELVEKYPAMNNIIKEYVKKVPEEITIYDKNGNTPMNLCFV